LDIPIPRQVAPQQKAHVDIKGLGPTIFSNIATGPSNGTYVAKLHTKAVSEMMHRREALREEEIVKPTEE
jgi:hypothetical protein